MSETIGGTVSNAATIADYDELEKTLSNWTFVDGDNALAVVTKDNQLKIFGDSPLEPIPVDDYDHHREKLYAVDIEGFLSDIQTALDDRLIVQTMQFTPPSFPISAKSYIVPADSDSVHVASLENTTSQTLDIMSIADQIHDNSTPTNNGETTPDGAVDNDPSNEQEKKQYERKRDLKTQTGSDSKSDSTNEISESEPNGALPKRHINDRQEDPEGADKNTTSSNQDYIGPVGPPGTDT